MIWFYIVTAVLSGGAAYIQLSDRSIFEGKIKIGAVVIALIWLIPVEIYLFVSSGISHALTNFFAFVIPVLIMPMFAGPGRGKRK